MPTKGFDTLTAGLHGLGGQRVWSLMISLFGDLAQAPKQHIDGPLLSAIMQGLRVKPEAARVALHRLRNDGWIISQKVGRISRHSLTDKGRAECVAANPRIYADPALSTGRWNLVLTEDTSTEQISEMTQRGFAPLVPRVFVGPTDSDAPQGALVLSADHAPSWLRKQIAPQIHQTGYENLLVALSNVKLDLPTPEDMDAIDIAVLRCLVVHNWRRLVLKHPELPAPLVDPDGASHQCHLLVANLLARYPRPELSAIKRCHSAA
ncbi:PaaX family transcriptional regulator C-terminal domain-containing protein [Sulfitobacter geojensis]|uniref:PaaX family transcriptional regulator C-terminal domain-containing protein n=1 Tax=Sulfitobacter geojensis TaxID=1342299 RepID=UPI0036DC3B65